MELPPDDGGLVMSEPELELPDDDLHDSEWLLGQLAVCAEGPDEPSECEPVVPLPDDLSRASCSCSQKCIARVMKKGAVHGA